jgi:hypothetical protein
MGRHYGFQSDNFLGITPLKNDWVDDFATFFIQNRLLPQLVSVSRTQLYVNDSILESTYRPGPKALMIMTGMHVGWLRRGSDSTWPSGTTSRWAAVAGLAGCGMRCYWTESLKS